MKLTVETELPVNETDMTQVKDHAIALTALSAGIIHDSVTALKLSERHPESHNLLLSLTEDTNELTTLLMMREWEDAREYVTGIMGDCLAIDQMIDVWQIDEFAVTDDE
jgi:hypothetical protein